MRDFRELIDMVMEASSSCVSHNERYAAVVSALNEAVLMGREQRFTGEALEGRVSDEDFHDMMEEEPRAVLPHLPRGKLFGLHSHAETLAYGRACAYNERLECARTMQSESLIAAAYSYERFSRYSNECAIKINERPPYL